MQGASSPHKIYTLWKTLIEKEWDVLCAVEHKCHDLARSVNLHLNGHFAYYAGQLSHHYLGVVIIS